MQSCAVNLPGSGALQKLGKSYSATHTLADLAGYVAAGFGSHLQPQTDQTNKLTPCSSFLRLHYPNFRVGVSVSFTAPPMPLAATWLGQWCQQCHSGRAWPSMQPSPRCFFGARKDRDVGCIKYHLPLVYHPSKIDGP